MTLNTPCGNPACCMRSATHAAASGAFSLVLTTTVFPVMSAGAAFAGEENQR
ncbi:hypothetical protein BJX62DRAFT_220290 [Aspergillus germanicus]